MYRLIAYLGILASIILGGILGLIASVLAFGALEADLGIVHLLIVIALGACIGGILAVIRVRRYLRERREKQLAKHLASVPENACELIKAIIRQMRYRKEVRQDVMAELVAHFEDELKDCKSGEEKEQKAQQLIADFGDVKLLGVLLRRAKKRCRPFWRTVAARTFQTIGILILCFIIYTAWFLTGKPVVTVDYVAEFNKLVRPAADNSLNASPLYDEAAELYEKLPDEVRELLGKRYKEASPEERRAIEQYLSENKEALDLVAVGAKKPYYWRRYISRKEEYGMMGILMPHLAEFRRLAYSLRSRAYLHVEDGRYEDAFSDIKTCYRFGRHLSGNKTLVEQLVSIAIRAVSVQTLRGILSEHQMNSATLTKLQEDFEQMIADEDFTVSLKFEKLTKYDEIQRCFTADRLGGGHISLEGLRRYQMLAGEGILYFAVLERFLMAPLHILFTHPNKQESREMADRCNTYWEKIAHKTPARIRAENIEVGRQAMELIKGNILLEMLAPAYSRVIEISYRLPADVGSTLTIIAILRYRQDKRGYPGSLEKLIEANYLKELPMDPWSDKPLVYKKTDEDFILYSFGQNCKDDGGQVHRDDKGIVKLWADEGDAVFWPVFKSENKR
ncbi:MAG: hypothetical protein ACYS0C_02765 [Planctomycetota bacterium]|jgi:hypothetical protein